MANRVYRSSTSALPNYRRRERVVLLSLCICLSVSPSRVRICYLILSDYDDARMPSRLSLSIITSRAFVAAQRPEAGFGETPECFKTTQSTRRHPRRWKHHGRLRRVLPPEAPLSLEPKKKSVLAHKAYADALRAARGKAARTVFARHSMMVAIIPQAKATSHPHFIIPSCMARHADHHPSMFSRTWSGQWRRGPRL